MYNIYTLLNQEVQQHKQPSFDAFYTSTRENVKTKLRCNTALCHCHVTTSKRSAERDLLSYAQMFIPTDVHSRHLQQATTKAYGLVWAKNRTARTKMAVELTCRYSVLNYS